MKILKAILIMITIANPVLAAEEGPVWFWFTDCGGPHMKLEVRLDKKIIYQSSFPICHAKRSSEHSKGQTKKLNFTFTSPRTIVWTGYRDGDQTSKANQKIEGDIWLAGADPDALLLGVSFIDNDTIYMNTIHIAHPNLKDASDIAAGIEIITSPDKEVKNK